MRELIDFMNSAAVLVASATAIWGISAWRRELIGRRRYELAEETLARFHEACDVVRSMRAPFLAGFGRFPTEGREDETEDERLIRGDAEFPSKIYEHRQELFGRLDAIKYRFMATFGAEHKQAFKELNTVILQIFGASRSLHQLSKRQVRNYVPEREKAIARMEAIRYGGDDDEIESRLKSPLDGIAEVCRKEMEREGFWRRLFRRSGHLRDRKEKV